MEFTILMPCLDEALTVETCVRKARAYLERKGIVGEILVADNGSSDGSQSLAEAAGARVVDIKRKGYGAALLGGIEAAKGRFVIMADADDSYDFTDLDGFVDELRRGSKLVVGNRFQGGIMPGAMPVLNRYLGNPLLSFIGRTLFSSRIGDFHCGMRGFDRQAILELGLRAPGMEFASEMVVKASLAQLDIAEVPHHAESGWSATGTALETVARWLAASAIHAASQPALAVLVSRLVVDRAGAGRHRGSDRNAAANTGAFHP